MIIAKKQSGFTLVEVIIVISIMGIIGGLSALIIGRSLDSYAALERREKLQTSIRLAVERMSRELRHALPHSVCVSNGAECDLGVASGIGSQFYFIPVVDSGRYQDKSGAYSLSAPPPPAPPPLRRKLPVTSPAKIFDVLSTNNVHLLCTKLAPRDLCGSGDWVVVYNLNNYSIYQAPNNIRNQINNIAQVTINNSATDTDNNTIDQITLGFPVSTDSTFSKNSPTRRFHIIKNDTVTLFSFENNALYRETKTFSNPASTSVAGRRLLIENVDINNSKFSYTPGSKQRSGLLHIEITVTKQNEKIRVIHNAHVYNTP